MVTLLQKEQRPPVTKALSKDVKAHVSVLKKHLAENHPSEAIATAMAMILLDPDHAVSCMRRDGVLRASRYEYRGSLIGRVAVAVLELRDVFAMSPDRIAYLESVKSLSSVAGDAGTLKKEIEATVRAHRSVVLKTVFVLVNDLFHREWNNDLEANSLMFERYSREEYAEAASFILDIYASMFPIDVESFLLVDPDAKGKNALIYQRLLVAAARLAKFREAEQLIDGLPYGADRKGECVTIFSMDPNIERAVRLGFIQQRNQALIRQFHLLETVQTPSIRTLVDKGFESGSFNGLIEIKENPVRRLLLRMPADQTLFDSTFASDELYLDEIGMLMELDVDHFGKFDDLIFPITDLISSLDILKVQRYFNFISCAYQRRLSDIQDPVERDELTLTSTLLAIPHKEMVKQMQLILGNEDKAREVIELLKMVPGNRHLDLQYRPFVDIGDFYMIAPHVVAVSNLVRNTIVANGLRSAAIGSKDLMVHSVSEAFRSAGFEVESDLNAKFNGQNLELDIVARRDDVLILLECKNAYHPVSIHEMRNSWEHIRSAAKQIEKRQHILVDPANQSLLFQRLGWKVSSKCAVHTGIVIANRVFHGASLNGHPIRQAHELISVLKSGRIAVRNGPDEESLPFWLGPEFQTADLTTYLGAKSIASDQLAALDARSWCYSIGSRELAFSSYVLDMVKFDKDMRERYKS